MEDRVVELARAYNGALILFDPSQAHLLTQRLRAESGVQTEEFPFTGPSTNRLARSLYAALRDHAVALPDDEAVVDELCTITLVQTGPGTIKIDHRSGRHNDIAVTIAMLIDRLTGNAGRVAFEARLAAALQCPPSIMGTDEYGQAVWSGGVQPKKGPKSRPCSIGGHSQCTDAGCGCGCPHPGRRSGGKYDGLGPLFS